MLRDLPWTDIRDGCFLVVPLGSVEQHGPHLPLDVDDVIAQAVATRVVDQLVARGRPVVLAPAIPYGASGEHQDFPGTVSIGNEALALLLIELGRSATEWASGVVFLTAHGGNGDALEQAVAVLQHEGRVVTWTACATPGADAHAGSAETSLMLHLDGDRVRIDRLEAGNTEPLRSLLPRLRAHGVRAVSANGILGDPRPAGADQGRVLLQAMVDRVCDHVQAWLATESAVPATDGDS